MGFFDTLLTAIAPERAVKRVAAQTAIRAINSGYSNYGASLHKKSMRGWMWHGGSPKEDIEDNLRVLRERSRDAYMGVPLATGAIKTMRTNVVCGGLTPTPQIDNAFLGISDEEAQKINEQIAREFALWANKPTCDADRIDNFYMLQQLAFTGFLLNGDSWAVLQNKKTPGVPYDLRVRIIEADRICSPAFMDILSPTDINEHHVEKIVQGVETDADGMVIAYWVCDRHPLASTSVTGLTASHWTRVEAYGKKTGRQNVLCLMQRERAGQLRGVPLLAPVLESLKQLGRFTDAELTAAVISAMFTVFIKKSDQSDEVPFGEMLPPDVQVDTPDKTSVELAPGAFIDLNPGEEVQFADPKHPTTGFEAFMNAIVKQMAAALEIPSEVLYKQFSTSYSAARGALNEFWRTTGILGKISAPNIGQFESIEQEVSFNLVYSSFVNVLSPKRQVNLTFRVAQQAVDKSLGYAYKGLRIVEVGRVKEFTPGKIKAGEGMEAKVKLELTYIMIENDGEEIIAIDKLNGVYRVQGEDMLADVTALI